MILLGCPRFKLCNELASKVLANQTGLTAMVDVTKLKYENNIVIDSIQNFCKITKLDFNTLMRVAHKTIDDGCLIKWDGFNFILYNAKTRSKKRINWTIAHEVGHIYLGHRVDGDQEEVEAHFFAAQLLMPHYTIHMITEHKGNITKDDIRRIFGVSTTAAEKRLQTIDSLTYHIPTLFDDVIWLETKEEIMDYLDRDGYVFEVIKDENDMTLRCLEHSFLYGE